VARQILQLRMLAAWALAWASASAGGCGMVRSVVAPAPEPPPPAPPVRWWAAPDGAGIPDGSDAPADAELPPPNPVWLDEDGRRVVSLAGAPGETVGFHLVIARDGVARTGMTLRFEDFWSAEGTIPAASASAYRADWVRAERFRPWYAAETGRPPDRPVLVADALTPVTAGFAADGRRNQPLFVDLRIPASAPPGTYRGKARLGVADGPAVEIELRLQVWPFLLPMGRTALPAIARINLSRLWQWEAGWTGPVPLTAEHIMADDPAAVRGRKVLAGTLDLLRSHGLRPVIEDLRPKADFRWPGTAVIDWTAYDAFLERFLPPSADRAAEPLVAPVSGGFPDPAKFAAVGRPPAGEPAEPDGRTGLAFYKRALRDYATQVARHLSELGRLDSAVVLYDPPAGATPEQSVSAAALFAGILAECRPAMPVAVPFSPRELRRQADDGSRSASVLLSAVTIWRDGGGGYEPPPESPDAPGRPMVWLTLGDPPFLPSRRIEAPGAAMAGWGWAAHRYRPDALDVGPAVAWSEPAEARRAGWPAADAESPPAETPPAAEGLTPSPDDDPPWVYPGGRPSVRLKLLRRALQDEQYLRVFAKVAGPTPAAALTRALLRWALHERPGAEGDEGKFGGWSQSGDDYESVRRDLARMAAASLRHRGGTAPVTGSPELDKYLARSERVELEIVGCRLSRPDPAKPGRLEVRVRLSNLGALPREDLGEVALGSLPPGWDPVRAHAAVPRLDAVSGAELQLSATVRPDAEWGGPAGPELEWRRPGLDPERIALPLRRHAARPVISHPPVIDGRLDEWGRWSDGAAAGFVSGHRFREVRGVVSAVAADDRPTSVRVAYDEQFAYFAVECRRRPGDRVFCRPGNQAGRDGPTLWGEDAVDLLLAPPPAATGVPARFHRITVKRNGVVERAVGPAGRLPTEPWAADVLAACSALDAADDAWRAEIRIPWAALGGKPPAGALWGVNYARHITATGETVCWSPSPRHIFRPETLGVLVFP
jgi:hypothetical protein